jgi:hypothetical protein
LFASSPLDGSDKTCLSMIFSLDVASDMLDVITEKLDVLLVPVSTG